MDVLARQEGIEPKPQNYSLILFVINEGANSKRARENLSSLCKKWLPKRHEIRIVDVLDDFQTALDYNILLTPSVVVTDPEPRITIHGDLSEADKFVEALNLKNMDKDG